MKSGPYCAAVLTACLAGGAAPAARADAFYLRLDAGGAASTNPGGNLYAGSGFGHDFGKSVTIGGGAGYEREIAPMFDVRADLTVTGYPHYVSTASANFGAPGPAGALSAKLGLDSIVGLANLYLDWRMPAMVTPYLGFGIGMAGLNLHQINYAIDGRFSGSENGSAVSNFAYGASAGVAIRLMPLWSVDIGYHYVNAGDARSSGVLTGPSGATVSLPPLKGTLESHAVSVGFRFSI